MTARIIATRRLCTNSIYSNKSRTSSNSHLALCHLLWREHMSNQPSRSKPLVIDATCGNGFDSVVLTGLCEQADSRLLCIDIQAKAITATRQRLLSSFGTNKVENQIRFLQQSHETFPSDIEDGSVDLVAYNLGYLPGSVSDGMNRVVSNAASTVRSLRAALPLVRIGGLITIVAYRGHQGGEEETNAITELVTDLPIAQWRVFSHVPLNTTTGPVLFSIYRETSASRKQKDKDS